MKTCMLCVKMIIEAFIKTNHMNGTHADDIRDGGTQLFLQ